MFIALRRCTSPAINAYRISRNQSRTNARLVRACNLHTSETPRSDEHSTNEVPPTPGLHQRTLAERIMLKYDSNGKEKGLKHTFVLASVLVACFAWYKCEEVVKARNHELGSLHVLFLLRLVLADDPERVAEDKITTLHLIQLFHDIFNEERDYVGRRIEKATNPQMEHIMLLIKEKFENAEGTKYVISLEDAEKMSEDEMKKLNKLGRAKVVVLKQSKYMRDVANGFKKGDASRIMHTLEVSFVDDLLPRLMEVLSEDNT